jgi:hypothetical protein
MERLLLGRRPRPMLLPDQLSVMMSVPQIAGSARDKISQFQQPRLEGDVVVGSEHLHIFCPRRFVRYRRTQLLDISSSAKSPANP